MIRAGDRVTTTTEKINKNKKEESICTSSSVLLRSSRTFSQKQCIYQHEVTMSGYFCYRGKEAEDKRTCKGHVEINRKSDLHQKRAANISPFNPKTWALLLFLNVWSCISLSGVVVCNIVGAHHSEKFVKLRSTWTGLMVLNPMWLAASRPE